MDVNPSCQFRHTSRKLDPMNTASQARARLKELSDPELATFLMRFFRTGPGEYGEGDKFLGLKVPTVRRVAREFRDLSLDEVSKLLKSKFHEERLLALVLLTNRFAKASEGERAKICKFYCGHLGFVNNWDLVDVSAPQILGRHLLERDRSLLYKLAKSKNLWKKRVAMVATFAFIREKQFDDTFEIAEILLEDSHDLIHKAVGWMLREAGKRDERRLRVFLDKHAARMPRTALRYAIEKFTPSQRAYYMGLRSRRLS